MLTKIHVSYMRTKQQQRCSSFCWSRTLAHHHTVHFAKRDEIIWWARRTPSTNELRCTTPSSNVYTLPPPSTFFIIINGSPPPKPHTESSAFQCPAFLFHKRGLSRIYTQCSPLLLSSSRPSSQMNIYSLPPFSQSKISHTPLFPRALFPYSAGSIF